MLDELRPYPTESGPPSAPVGVFGRIAPRLVGAVIGAALGGGVAAIGVGLLVPVAAAAFTLVGAFAGAVLGALFLRFALCTLLGIFVGMLAAFALAPALGGLTALFPLLGFTLGFRAAVDRDYPDVRR